MITTWEASIPAVLLANMPSLEKYPPYTGVPLGMDILCFEPVTRRVLGFRSHLPLFQGIQQPTSPSPWIGDYSMAPSDTCHRCSLETVSFCQSYDIDKASSSLTI